MLLLVSGMSLVYSGAERRVLQQHLQTTGVLIVGAIGGHNHSLSQYVQCCLLIPPRTSLQNSSVRQPPCPLPTGAAVGADEEVVDPPTQGTVQGVDLCVETWIALGTWSGWTPELLAKT